MRKDEFIGQSFHWFTGVIENIDDEKYLNRVKVRCHGYHPLASKGENSVTTDELPWATVMMPVTSAGTPNVGSNHHLEVGSWVVGFFRDGPSAQDPVVIGSLTTSTDDIYDLHHSASTTNKIYRSKAGHLIEIENGTFTPAVKAVTEQPATGEGTIWAFPAVEEVIGVPESQSGDYLRVTHRGGTKIEIDEDGNTTIDTKGKTTIKSNGDVNVTSTAGNITVASGVGKKTTII
jgi:hypothetical protein